jgi:hypothetical protein
MSQTYLVAQWRGTDTGHRAMGTALPESAAIRRIALVGRLFPDYAKPKAYAIEPGNTDVLAVVRTYQ